MDSAVPGTGARSLKTAAAVLRALRLLGDHPDGMLPAELAVALGKSAATARYLVNTLCVAGYAERTDDGRCRLSVAPPWGPWGSATPAAGGLLDAVRPLPRPADLAPGEPAPGSLLAEAVTDLYRATRQRTYLVRRSGSVVATVCDTRGHQGLARVPGLDVHIPPQQAHALGLTRVLLAASHSYRDAVESDPLAALTARTLTTVTALRRELDEVRRRGWAADDGEFADGFATVAAPVVSPSGTSTVAIGLSCSARRLAADRDALVEAVVEVAEATRAAWARAAETAETGAQRPTSVRPKARNRR